MPNKVAKRTVLRRVRYFLTAQASHRCGLPLTTDVSHQSKEALPYENRYFDVRIICPASDLRSVCTVKAQHRLHPG